MPHTRPHRRSRSPPIPPSSPLALPLYLLTRLLSPVLLSLVSFLRSHSTPHPRLLLYDGVCNVCNVFINLVIDHDPSASFHFLPLSSPLAHRLLSHYHIPPHTDSMVLIDHADELIRHLSTHPSPLTSPLPRAMPSTLHLHSTAFLTTLASLGFPYSLTSLLLLIPAPLRDLGYRLFASIRYKVFGTGESCRVMTKDVRRRFIEAQDGGAVGGGKEEKLKDRKVK